MMVLVFILLAAALGVAFWTRRRRGAIAIFLISQAAAFFVFLSYATDVLNIQL